MKTNKVTSSDGVRLHVVETGNPEGRPILFVHGISQCWLAWSSQLDSDLAHDFRLVALDLRGHGMSDKPKDESYKDSKAWADDINSVITTLELNEPILVGWSYGPLVMLDYIRHYGEEQIGGMEFIGGITKLGSEEAISVLQPEFLALVPGFFSTDVEESRQAMRALIGLCFTDVPAENELYTMLGYNLSAPPFVREAMLYRSFDNDDLLPKLRKPLLLTQGTKDKIVRITAAEQIKSAVGHATLVVMEGCGHTPFREKPEKFNARLRDFAQGARSAATRVS
jgi:non-heme chloroperoxidase